MYTEINFNVLVGKTIEEIKGMEYGSEAVIFKCTDGSRYRMFHDQDCCESVRIEDVCGCVADLIGSPVLRATEDCSCGENPDGVDVPEYQDSFTWTFYNIATIKGHVTIRWYGESNGYYSERVSFVCDCEGRE